MCESVQGSESWASTRKRTTQRRNLAWHVEEKQKTLHNEKLERKHHKQYTGMTLYGILRLISQFYNERLHSDNSSLHKGEIGWTSLTSGPIQYWLYHIKTPKSVSQPTSLSWNVPQGRLSPIPVAQPTALSLSHWAHCAIWVLGKTDSLDDSKGPPTTTENQCTQRETNWRGRIGMNGGKNIFL